MIVYRGLSRDHLLDYAVPAARFPDSDIAVRIGNDAVGIDVRKHNTIMTLDQSGWIQRGVNRNVRVNRNEDDINNGIAIVFYKKITGAISSILRKRVKCHASIP